MRALSRKTDMRTRNPQTLSEVGFESRHARLRHDGRPRISIVSVVKEGAAALAPIVTSRATRRERSQVELILVCAGARVGSPSGVGAAGMRLVHGPADATDAQLRALGLAAASGDIVMMMDHATVDWDWIDHVCDLGSESLPADATRSPGMAPSADSTT